MSSDPQPASNVPLPGGNFQLLVQRFGYQALINLGVLENPVTGAKTIDLGHAQTVMDDLSMLREKTRGNLEEEEDAHLTKVIDELKGHFQRVAES